MKWLAVIGSVISGAVLVLRWWLSDEQTKLRALKNDKDGQKTYINKMAGAYSRAADGDIKIADDLLRGARKFWLERVQENNRLRR